MKMVVVVYMGRTFEWLFNIFRYFFPVVFVLVVVVSCQSTEVHMTEEETEHRDSLIREELSMLREKMADSCRVLKKNEIPLVVDSLIIEFRKDIEKLRKGGIGG